MKAAFIHDHNFYINPQDNQVYDTSGGAFDPKLWDRYLKIFDSLIVIGRKSKAIPNKLILSSKEKVNFFLIDDLKKGQDRFLKRKLISLKLEQKIRNIDFAIIRLPSTLGYYSISICKELKIPYTLEIVGDPFDAYWNYGNLAGKILAPLESFKMKQATKKSKSTIYVTAKELQKKYPTFKLQDGISNVRLEELIPFQKVQDFYSQDSKCLKIVLIGSFLVKYKGHIEALKIIRELVKVRKTTNIQLFFIGSGNPTWLEKIITNYGVGDYVEIVGTLKSGKDGIIPFLDSIHLLINTSKQEGLPRVVIEAMSRGRLCLASNAGGTAELLEPEHIHKAGDWRTVVDQIEEIHKMNSAQKIKFAEINHNKAADYLENNLQLKRNNILIETLKAFDENYMDAN